MKRILRISPCSPGASSKHAGGNTYNFYFNFFYNLTSKFNISVITMKDDDIDKSQLYKKCENFVQIDLYNIPLYKKIINVNYKLNIFCKTFNILSDVFKKQLLISAKKLKDNGYYPDIIIFERTQTLLLISDFKKLFPKSKFVSSEHDVSFLGYRRKASYFKGFKKYIWYIRYKFLKRNELKCLQQCDLIKVHNKDNKKLLVDNYIESDQVSRLVPYFNNLADIRLSNRKDGSKHILFFGAMSRVENYSSCIWFINSVMPLLSSYNFKFVILGSNPPKELFKYKNNNVDIIGFVKDIKSYFENSLCFVAPLLLGAGIKVKVLEALSSGLPVLANSIAIEGINAISKRDYLHCETASDYANYIIEIANGKYTNIGDNGKRFIEQNFNMRQSCEIYEKELDSLEGVNNEQKKIDYKNL